METHFFYKDVSALSFTDRTPSPDSRKDLIADIKENDIKSICADGICELDKQSLPSELIIYNNENSEYERDLSKSVSYLLILNKQLINKVTELENRIKVLEQNAQK